MALDDLPVMTASQAAEVLGVSRQRIHQLIKAGTLAGTRHGVGVWLLDVASVSAYSASPTRHKGGG